jgi:hypothetical protein
MTRRQIPMNLKFYKTLTPSSLKICYNHRRQVMTLQCRSKFDYLFDSRLLNNGSCHLVEESATSRTLTNNCSACSTLSRRTATICMAYCCDTEATSVVRWLACWPLVHKIAGSNPAEAVWFFGWKKSSECLPSEGKQSCLPNVADLRHVKQPYNLPCEPQIIG